MSGLLLFGFCLFAYGNTAWKRKIGYVFPAQSFSYFANFFFFEVVGGYFLLTEAFPKHQFWKSYLRLIKKTGLLDGFPKPFSKPYLGFENGSTSAFARDFFSGIPQANSSKLMMLCLAPLGLFSAAAHIIVREYEF